MKREEVLRAAEMCVCRDRENQYGSPENNFKMISKLWETYTGFPITSEDVAIMMTLLKIARIATGDFKEDSFVDACGYLACGAEIASKYSEEI